MTKVFTFLILSCLMCSAQSRHNFRNVILSNSFNWTGYYAATRGGEYIVNQCKKEDTRYGVRQKFGTAPVYGMPSYYYKNALPVNVGITLTSFILYNMHHYKSAILLPFITGVGQYGIYVGDRIGSCN